jgi:effector-binding domain-containing protein
VEVPLDEIGRFLRATEPAAAREILDLHRARLAARVEGYRAMLADIDRLATAGRLAYEVRTKDLVPQQALSIRVRTRLAVLVEEAPRAFAQMGAHLERAQVAPAGPPFALYHGSEFDEEAVDVEWCVPVSRPVSGVDRMDGREVPGGRVAFTLHAGPYDAVGPGAYAALQGWMQEHGHESDGPPREVYLVGPCHASDPAAFRTELQWPIR